MAPDDFLPPVAEMGMLVELGAHMMRASAAAAGRLAQGPPAAGDYLVQRQPFHRRDRPAGLVDDVADLWPRPACRRGSLKLEITESDIMRDPDRAAVILRSLRDAGAGLALDDFGTGFSSLTYLTRLPFDTLKIDRYFVRTMATNEGSAKIVRSVIQLGRTWRWRSWPRASRTASWPAPSWISAATMARAMATRRRSRPRRPRSISTSATPTAPPR